MSTRTPIYLNEELLARAYHFFLPGELSQILGDLLAERVAELERAELEAQMREGYLAVKQERQELNADWDIVDGESWPACRVHNEEEYG